MHVTLLGPFPPPHGGVQTHVVALRTYLRSAGTRVSGINITRHRKVDEDDLYYPRSAGGVLARLARLRPDVLHIHLGGQLSRRDLALCFTCAQWPATVSVMTFHSGGYPKSPKGRAASPHSLAGLVLRRLDHLVAVNSEIENLFHRFGVLPSRTSLIGPHAVLEGPGQTAPVPGPLADFIGSHPTLLLSVGLLESEYRIPTQIEALAEVRRQVPDAGLIIAGSGSLEAELRSLIAQSPVSPHICLAGDLPHALTLQLIDRAALLLRTTAFDGDSLSVREAMGRGTRVLASDNGLRPAGVHLLCRPEPAHLAQRIAEVLVLPPPPASQSVQDASNLAAIHALYLRLLT